MSQRAYSLLTIKAIDEDKRIIEGIATTPSADRYGDIVEPDGAEFTLPLPLLWQHDSWAPVGHVIEAKVTKAGIHIKAQIAKIDEAGVLKDRLDEAWQSIKAKLVRGLSIGFRAIESLKIEGTWSYRFVKWEWLELSCVTIAANQDATIQAVKSIDTALRAASGREQRGVVRLTSPVASGTPQPKRPEEGKPVKISEKIRRYEEKRAANIARMTAIHEETDQSLTKEQREEIDTLEAEVATIDSELPGLKKIEATLAKGAKPINAVADGAPLPAGASAPAATPGVSVKPPPTLEKGIAYAQLVKVKMAAKLTGDPALLTARKMYGENSEVFAIITKANEVVAGSTLSGNWAADLVSPEGAAIAAFLEYLRPATILGKFGTDGIPALTKLDFYMPYIIETGGGDAYWVGQGKPKPLTAFDYDRSTMTPLKIANIAVLTEENIRYSTPNSDVIVRNALAKAIIAGIDVAFVDPANDGTANVKPASITNGAESIVSTGDEEDDVRRDLRALRQKFIDANNTSAQGVYIMSESTAEALDDLINALGQPVFPSFVNNRRLKNRPVIVSQHIGDVVALVAADQIFLGDEGGVAVDMSREASIEMRSAGLGMDATAGTATAASVSMFQTNSVALRAERTINWKRSRPSAVAYLTGVSWGGAVPAS